MRSPPARRILLHLLSAVRVVINGSNASATGDGLQATEIARLFGARADGSWGASAPLRRLAPGPGQDRVKWRSNQAAIRAAARARGGGARPGAGAGQPHARRIDLVEPLDRVEGGAEVVGLLRERAVGLGALALAVAREVEQEGGEAERAERRGDGRVARAVLAAAPALRADDGRGRPAR